MRDLRGVDNLFVMDGFGVNVIGSLVFAVVAAGKLWGVLVLNMLVSVMGGNVVDFVGHRFELNGGVVDGMLVNDCGLDVVVLGSSVFSLISVMGLNVSFMDDRLVNMVDGCSIVLDNNWLVLVNVVDPVKELSLSLIIGVVAVFVLLMAV